uniref:Putative oxidoreductase protein n=1 Tax=uncultured bacterium contig00027 TaxID=1181516 RepID=A0A806KFP8_9BACT|nr:putative oxidoreductase protein [uncultured bacterium contig00027]
MIKIGIAGVRGLSVMSAFHDITDAKVTALCDINNEVLNAQADKNGIANRFRIFEDMLMSDVDAVVIATPIQCHVQQAILALNAGKHVLSEVTAGASLDELFWLVEETEKSGKVYMMAENYLYIPFVQHVLAMARAGLFGDPYYGEGEYLHDISNYMTYPDGRPSWRQWWMWGMRGLFYPTHSLGPVMKWFGDDRIDFVIALGSGWRTRPEIRQEDTSVAILQMKSGKLIRLRVDCVSKRPHSMYNYTLQGTKGAYESPRTKGEHMVYIAKEGSNPDNAQWEPLSNYNEYLPERCRNTAEHIVKSGHGGGDYFIVQDFLDAVKGKIKPAVDVYEACEWTAVGLLSALSVANRGRAMDMPDFRSKNIKDKTLKL